MTILSTSFVGCVGFQLFSPLPSFGALSPEDSKRVCFISRFPNPLYEAKRAWCIESCCIIFLRLTCREMLRNTVWCSDSIRQNCTPNSHFRGRFSEDADDVSSLLRWPPRTCVATRAAWKSARTNFFQLVQVCENKRFDARQCVLRIYNLIWYNYIDHLLQIVNYIPRLHIILLNYRTDSKIENILNREWKRMKLDFFLLL